MQPSDILKGSDGTGNAVLAHVTLNRLTGATTLKVDSVSKWPTATFIATFGTLDGTGFLTPASVGEIVGHITAGDIIIDSFEPGTTDVGNTAGQVVVLKQTTGWANRIAAQLNTLQTFTPMSGIIAPFAGRTAPANWLLCNGAVVSRATYPTLFSAIVPLIGTFTVTIATPGVFTLNAHGLQLGDPVYLTTTSALPTGLTANTIYYAVPINANTFNLATTQANAIAGTLIATTGSQAGIHSLFHCPYGNGDGTTTFAIPDLRSRIPLGAGAGQYVSSFAPTDVTIATDVIVVPQNNTLITGQKIRLTTTGGLPAGLALATDYYVIRQNASSIKLATSLANAVAGAAIDITTQGTGVHTLTLLYTNNNLGTQGGEETHAQTTNELALHNHGLPNGGTGNVANNPGAFLNAQWTNGTAGATGSANGTGTNGSGAAANVLNPFLALNYIIKT